MRFQPGDIVRGTERGRVYAITDEHMKEAVVLKSRIEGYNRAEIIDVKILDHVDGGFIGGTYYALDADLFDLIEAPCANFNSEVFNSELESVLFAQP